MQQVVERQTRQVNAEATPDSIPAGSRDATKPSCAGPSSLNSWSFCSKLMRAFCS
jgi:hypothetical protein